MEHNMYHEAVLGFSLQQTS